MQRLGPPAPRPAPALRPVPGSLPAVEPSAALRQFGCGSAASSTFPPVRRSDRASAAPRSVAPPGTWPPPPTAWCGRRRRTTAAARSHPPPDQPPMPPRRRQSRCQRECDLLCRCGAGLSHVVARDRDRVPPWQVIMTVGEGVADQAQRCGGRKDVGASRDVLLEDIVLDSSGEPRRWDALLLGNQLVQQ